jgi:hypothetical protein
MECTDDSTQGAKKEIMQFPWKLHEMLDNADIEGFSFIVSRPHGSTNSFKVHQPAVFAVGIMPRYFKKCNKRSRGKIQVKNDNCKSSAAPLVV